jgi:hypothetical protein
MATNTNPTPKQRFQSTKPALEAHRAMMQRPEFEYGCDMALLEYQLRLSSQATTFNDAAANNFKITDAMEFLAVLRNLAESTSIPIRKDLDNLTQPTN